MSGYVYILGSKTKVLYVGVTNNLERRVFEHKSKEGSIFTSRYNIYKLLYFEETDDIMVAIEREKEIKKWRRNSK